MVWRAVLCPPPFADSEGIDDTEEKDEGFFDDDNTGEYDATDNGDFEEFDEETDNIDKSISQCIRKSKEHGIIPQRQYLKALSEDQYDKLIGKDAYAFLHGHEEELIEVLAVGKDVSDDFKTLSAIDVREVYWIIISEIEKVGWSSKHMVEQLMEKFPQLEKYQAKRIIQTETTRIINYCKEFIAERGDLGEYNYGWVGPLDYRTTPMCWYLQTGELRDSDKELLRKLGRSESELPPIPEEGMPLEQLKETCRKVAEVFGQDMISDWVMHINCRHTFARGNKRLDLEYAEPSEIEQIVDDLLDMPDEDTHGSTYIDSDYAESGGLFVDLETIEEDDGKLYTQVYDGFDSYIFINSIYGMPILYNEDSTDEVFVFETMNEKDVASWARLVVQLREENLDDVTIMWALSDTGNLEDDVLGYIVTHADEIYTRAENEGWFD